MQQYWQNKAARSSVGLLMPHAQRVQVPNNWGVGCWVRVTIVEVLGKDMIISISYLDP